MLLAHTSCLRTRYPAGRNLDARWPREQKRNGLINVEEFPDHLINRQFDTEESSFPMPPRYRYRAGSAAYIPIYRKCFT
jgi:hypothetical protein